MGYMIDLDRSHRWWGIGSVQLGAAADCASNKLMRGVSILMMVINR